MTKTRPNKKLKQLAQDYFDYMGRQFPTMCLSDEFYFFPRAKSALRFLDRLDSLDKEKIKQNIAKVKEIKSSLQKIDTRDMDLEAAIDHALLNQSISTFLREFGEFKIWRINPNLYLKIILLGIEQLLIKAPYFKEGFSSDLLSKLRL